MGTTICYYISSHGLGHASRACQVIRALPPEFEVIIKSMAPEQFLRRESGGRRFELIAERHDAGLAQASNTEVDWQRSVDEAWDLHDGARRIAAREASYLRERQVSAVACDAPPLPLRAARDAGLPSVTIANFTWIEIFRRAARHDARVRELARQWRSDYSSATICARPSLAFSLPYFPRMEDVGLIATRGRSRRAALAATVASAGLPATRLAMLYFGAWGDRANAERERRIARIAEDTGTTFVSLFPMPPPVLSLDPEHWDFSDLVASVDVVLAKAGYGTTAACMANGTPMIFYPRLEFSEYLPLSRGVIEWGGGIRIPARDFLGGRWDHALRQAGKLRPRIVPAPGARRVAALIARLARREA